MAIERLAGAVRDYDWGSTTALAALSGRSPTGAPEAEIWFGARRDGSATLPDSGGITLADRIEADPAAALGSDVAAEHDASLPFLVKLLAAAEPLSIQVHPTAEQAAAGYAREDEAGIDLGARERSYRDARHKPELLCPIAPFEALVGFRRTPATLELLRALGLAHDHPLVATLAENGPGAALRCALGLPSGVVADTIAAMVAGAAGVDERWRPEADVVVRLANRHPGDPGVLVAALLNRITLSPGDALFVRAGTIHSYLEGVAVEVMANSDNVLRGGLTSKHVDVNELLAIVDPEPSEPDVLEAQPGEAFPTPVDEFAVMRLVDPSYEIDVISPHVVVCTAGRVRLAAEEHTVELGPGDAAWVGADTGRLGVRGEGTVFVVTVGDAPMLSVG